MAAACQTTLISRSSCDAALKLHGEIPSDDIDSHINNADEHVSGSSKGLFTNLWTLNAFRMPYKRSLGGYWPSSFPHCPLSFKVDCHVDHLACPLGTMEDAFMHRDVL
ncbi:hypothetical protein CDAR_189471 [Caerostris darwini]|uniref:Uncharacterized protein n=1 Tax=Caerostris darwini TaxID=1538125 RepID=A0AAV4QS55_9ARAC|nr:hypothetical protein CDAR_189471 [Caerostris darwini]